MNFKSVLQVIFIFAFAQMLIWFQQYGQFRWQWFRDNTWALLLSSIPITWILIEGSRIGMVVFENQSWPLRFVGFSTGIIIFAIFSRIFLGEEMTVKSAVSLLLCFVLLLIQLLWK